MVLSGGGHLRDAFLHRGVWTVPGVPGGTLRPANRFVDGPRNGFLRVAGDFLLTNDAGADAPAGLHRRIGMLSAIVAVAMIVLGYQTAIAMARRGFDLSGDLGIRSDPLAGIAFPLLDIFLFAVLYVAAYLYRRRAAIHKRLMLLAVFGALMPAPITHLLGHYEFLRNKPWMAPLLVGAFLAACAIHDRIVLRRIHPVSLWAALAIFIVDNLWFAVVMPSAAWHAFASKLVG